MGTNSTFWLGLAWIGAVVFVLIALGIMAEASSGEFHSDAFVTACVGFMASAILGFMAQRRQEEFLAEFRNADELQARKRELGAPPVIATPVSRQRP